MGTTGEILEAWNRNAGTIRIGESHQAGKKSGDGNAARNVSSALRGLFAPHWSWWQAFYIDLLIDWGVVEYRI